MNALNTVAQVLGSTLKTGGNFLLVISNLASGRKLSNLNSEKDGHKSGRPSAASLSDDLLSFLAPFEECFVSIQNILIWERPLVSAVSLIAFNCFYWIAASWSRRFFSILSIIVLIFSVHNCWSCYIWPEIRARPPENDGTEGWTSIHPKVLSAPELSRYLNEIVKMGVDVSRWLWNLRKNQPGYFCFLMSGILGMIAVVGHLVPGVVIVYIITMTIALGPGFNLYVLPDNCLSSVRDLFKDKKEHSSSSPASSSLSPKNEKISSYELDSDSDEPYDGEKDESSLQLLSNAQLEQTLDFEADPSVSKVGGSMSRAESNSSLQLLPPNLSTSGTETGDELDEYEIISDSEVFLTDENKGKPKDKIETKKVNFKDLLESDL